MKPYTIKKFLAARRAPVLPSCTFERTIQCSQCIYFETHSPDSKGQCRCSYRGRWYYPHEGCTNGMTIPQPLYGPVPPHTPAENTDFDPRQNIPQPLYGPAPPGFDHFDKKKGIRLSIILIILIAALLAAIFVFTSLRPFIPFF